MRSELQNQASRANGSKSRGPVTEEGKLASSQNAIKHGILSECVVLYGESAEAFQALAAQLYADLQPQNCIEEDLVNTMAVARWRRIRIWHLEKSALEVQMEREHDQNPAANHPPVTLAGLAFRSLSDNSRTLDLINRYESRYDRQYHRAYRRLLELRDRPQPTPPCSSEPEITDSAKGTQAASGPAVNGPAATSRGTGPAATSRGSWNESFESRGLFREPLLRFASGINES